MGRAAISIKRLSSGYWLVRGHGPCNYSQPPHWPTDAETLRRHAHPEAGPQFLAEAARKSKEVRDEIDAKLAALEDAP